MLLFDAHLDLALNAIEWNRDLTAPIDDIRRAKRISVTSRIAAAERFVFLKCVAATSGCASPRSWPASISEQARCSGWRSHRQAWAMTRAQLAWYRAMEEVGELAQIRDRAALDRHLALWSETNVTAPIGYLLSLEGADSLISLAHLERAWEDGLRAVGPAHYGPGVYAFGTDSTGGFNPRGRDLLKEMRRLGIILDATHLSDDCFWEALDLFDGPVWASHHNCRALVPHNRQLSDEQIRALVARGAVIVPRSTRG
jgi:membrane dipeptidase